MVLWLSEIQAIRFEITSEQLQESKCLDVLKYFLSDDDRNLPRASDLPVSLVEDLTVTFRKWTRGDLSNDPRRSLMQREDGRSTSAIDPTWPFKRSAAFYGEGDLVNGQRWPSRIAMVSVGAHGRTVAGIHGHRLSGAYAVVMGLHGQGQGYYADRDLRDRVWYLGTAQPKKNERDKRQIQESDGESGSDDENEEDEGDEKLPTSDTLKLFASIRSGNPVRLFRSSKLPRINLLRPLQGYRYDGLYKVVDFELLEEERQIYRFEFHRLPGQGPIRKHDYRTFD